MNIIKHRIPGQIIVDGERAALIIHEPETEDEVYLSYALYTMGVETHILPALALDDWGNEIKGLRLYNWIRQYGNQFPRAEVFGKSPDGKESQFFLRDLELFSRFPLYAFPDKESSISDGVLIDAVLILDNIGTDPRLASPPDSVKFPLREARVTWWNVPGLPENLNFLE